MRQTKTLLLPSASAWSAGLCRLPQAPAGKWPFPTLSLQSLHGCLDPYPATFPRCIYPFLPGEHRPHVRSETFGTLIRSHIATSVGHVFRGCSHSVMFRPPCSLDPQVAPTAENLLRAAGPFTPRNGHVVTHMNCGIATCLNRAIGMAGLSPAGLQPCRLLPGSVHEELPHTAPTSGTNAEISGLEKGVQF
jgi:hypothetical protein